MARISGVNLPLNKRVEIGLTYIYGVGRPQSTKLLAQLGISPDTYVRDSRSKVTSGARFPRTSNG
jgi:small subunit ribosomal protein S13